MAVKIEGNFELLRIMIERDGDKARAAALEVMDEKAGAIVEKARDNAPRDRFNLERAINRYPKKSPENRKQRGADGRFIAYKVQVGVDSTIADKETGAIVNIDQYSTIMHESPTAGADTEANRQKRAEGKNPGRKYLERAFDEIDPTVVPEMIQKIRSSI